MIAELIAKLSTMPTARHPFGLRHAVLERAAILIADAGWEPEKADQRAYDLEVGGQLRIGGVG